MANEEQWKRVKGYDKYEISDQGRVWSEYRGKLLKPTRERSGHHHVMLHRRESPREWLPKVHLLVLESFAGPRPEGMIGLHLDGDLGNNELSNLKWGTRAALTAKLTEQNVISIRERYAKGKVNKAHKVTLKELAREFGVTHPTIQRVVKRKTWRHLP
jgi:hypothetical protein